MQWVEVFHQVLRAQVLAGVQMTPSVLCSPSADPIQGVWSEEHSVLDLAFVEVSSDERCDSYTF